MWTLAICLTHGSVYMSIPISQFIPVHINPFHCIGSTHSFSTVVSLLQEQGFLILRAATQKSESKMLSITFFGCTGEPHTQILISNLWIKNKNGMWVSCPQATCFETLIYSCINSLLCLFTKQTRIPFTTDHVLAVLVFPKPRV